MLLLPTPLSKLPQPLGPSASPAFVGLTLSALLQGAIPFAAAGGLLSQDASRLVWDDTNKRLGLGLSTPAGRLHLKQSSNTLAGGLTIEKSDASLSYGMFMDANNSLIFGYQGSSDLRLTSLKNLLLNASAAGTSAKAALVLGTDTAPTASPADAIQMYSADKAAGRACPTFRTEDGVIISLEQNLDKTSLVEHRTLTLSGSSMETASTIKGGTTGGTQEWVGLALKRNASGSDTETLMGFYDRLTVSEDFAAAIGSKRRSTGLDYSMVFKVKNNSDSLGTAEAMRLGWRGNLMLGGNADNPGGASKSLVIFNGIAPTSNITDASFIYSADQAAGNACMHTRTEAGHIIKLYRQSHIADASGGSTVDAEARAAINSILAALENTGLLATA